MSIPRRIARPICSQLVSAARRSLLVAPHAVPRASAIPAMRAVHHAHRSSCRSYSTGTTFNATPMNIETYHRISDATLDQLDEYLEDLADGTDMAGFDVEYSQGVMTIKLGAHGTYVINKQPPNQQIWLSSPKSGPKRYDWDDEQQKWFYTRDNHTLDELLNTELTEVFGQPIDVLEGFSV